MNSLADRAAEARTEIERGISIYLPKICLDFIEVTIREALLAHEIDVRREYWRIERTRRRPDAGF
jgi:hypothetical protein